MQNHAHCAKKNLQRCGNKNSCYLLNDGKKKSFQDVHGIFPVSESFYLMKGIPMKRASKTTLDFIKKIFFSIMSKKPPLYP